jgi:hypothetical protein
MTVIRAVSLTFVADAGGPEGLLLHVLPDLSLQHVGDQEEDEQEADHPDT